MVRMMKLPFAMVVKYTDNYIMKNIYFFQNESCSDNLFKYPCKDPNSKHLEKRTVAVYDNYSIVKAEWFTELGAEVLMNPSDDDMLKAKIAVVMPNNGKAYYEVLDYYIQILQKLVRSMKSKHNFKHIIVVLPAKSDEYSTDLSRMAHYAVYGLIKGLGKMYAPFGLTVNGIILNEEEPTKFFQERVVYLASDNSCNTIGQIFKL